MRALRHTHPALAASTRAKAADSPARPARGHEASTAAPLGLRLLAFVSRRELDRRILAGEPRDATPALALRAAQLTDPEARRQTARRLRGIVAYVDRSGPRPLITAVVIDPPAVRSGRQAILGLAQRLEAPITVEPRGMILAQRLLTDGLGPLFNPSSERTVVAAVWETVDALEGRPTREIDFSPEPVETAARRETSVRPTRTEASNDQR